MSDYIDFVTSTHSLYDKYYQDWRLCINSFHGGPEYKNAHYLRAYATDLSTPSETINTYERADDGSYVSKSRVKVEYGMNHQDVSRGQDWSGGNFYNEKLDNTPLYNYVKLIVAEYNSILFRNAPQRYLGESIDIEEFIENVDGEGNSINEFMSQVDMLTTIYGVLHIGCYKPVGSDLPKFKIHTPTDVTNWSYKYDIDGNLKLDSMVVHLEGSSYHDVYRVMSEEYIDTVFVGNESNEEDYIPPVESELLEQLGDNTYRIRQVNELGYIPVVTLYQNVKVYNNIGSTVVMDVAQIQRSVYGDMAEIYSAITYGAHPTLIVDETTDALNDGQVGAEPGAVIRVQGGLTGEQNYAYEFVAPTLDAITQIRDLVDSKIDKMTQIAMLRSEELIRASRSGEQIEIYDDKLAALIRKKATNLENTENKLWDIYFDWTNQNKSDDFSVSYSRQYNKRALEQELKEIDTLMMVMDKYESMYKDPSSKEVYQTQEQAETRASQLGGSGYHTHMMEDGTTIYMPFATHEELDSALGYEEDEEQEDFKDNMRHKIRRRLEQLLSSSSTDNSL